MKIVDLEGRKSHFVVTTYDTPDGLLKRQGVFVLVKEYVRRRKPKFVVRWLPPPLPRKKPSFTPLGAAQLTVKVNSVDPDTLHPPLSEPQDAYKKRTRQKLEQDIHMNYTKFAQATQIRLKADPQVCAVRACEGGAADRSARARSCNVWRTCSSTSSTSCSSGSRGRPSLCRCANAVRAAITSRAGRPPLRVAHRRHGTQLPRCARECAGPACQTHGAAQAPRARACSRLSTTRTRGGRTAPARCRSTRPQRSARQVPKWPASCHLPPPPPPFLARVSGILADAMLADAEFTFRLKSKDAAATRACFRAYQLLLGSTVNYEKGKGARLCTPAHAVLFASPSRAAACPGCAQENARRPSGPWPSRPSRATQATTPRTRARRRCRPTARRTGTMARGSTRRTSW